MENNDKTLGTEKKGFFTKLYDGGQKVILKVRSTRGGRALIRVTKGMALAAGLYGTYRLGQKSIKPATVYITEGCAEEAPMEEPEETTEEVTEND